MADAKVVVRGIPKAEKRADEPPALAPTKDVLRSGQFVS